MDNTKDVYGPTLPISKEIHAMKYRSKGESFSECCTRFADTLKDDYEHFKTVRSIILDMRFLGGGRTQTAIGAPREVTAFNCFVSGTIEDSMDSIMDKAKEAAQTMRLGGGIGYDFSTLRPKGDRIVSLDSKSSGPVSFMKIFNAICQTIASAGHRRGAQMGVLRVDHPDIEDFIKAKQNEGVLEAFNVSVGVTDEFMKALKEDTMFHLRFNGEVCKSVRAKYLWDEIMRSTWDWAEPGVLYIDRINEMNNLHYCETIVATNPCGEQPLPPYGACLLGSFNLVKYIEKNNDGYYFDVAQFEADIPPIVRAMDNIHDCTVFPLQEQQVESQNKRRMGIGLTGVANTGEILGYSYGSSQFLEWYEGVLTTFRDGVYNASIELAKEKGPFPLFDTDQYLQSGFIKTLPQGIRRRIKKWGIRNSHLLSIAPTGTISLSADNVSGGIEPVFSHYYDRTIQTPEGPKVERVTDYAYREFGVKGKTAIQCTTDEHLAVLALSTKYIDSSCSKTINISPGTDWEAFKQVYIKAFDMGCKGCTTFNPEGKRYGILNEVSEDEGTVKADPADAQACFIDPITGHKECS